MIFAYYKLLIENFLYDENKSKLSRKSFIFVYLQLD